MPEPTLCRSFTVEGSEVIYCELPVNHGPINVRECARIRGDSDWEMHAEGETSDHLGGGGFWNGSSTGQRDTGRLLRISAEQAGDARVEYLSEPGAVEIRIAALQAAATIYSGGSGYANIDDVIARARKFETFILEAPA